jgi:signal peptidase I
LPNIEHPMSSRVNNLIPAICRLAVGVALVALIAHTWFVMGLVVPVTVAGSSMAPTLSGPRECYRCDACGREFAIGIDQLASVSAVCPDCDAWSNIRLLGTRNGDRLLVDRTAFVARPPRRWEIAVFRAPSEDGPLCVKRVVGLPGETVAIRDGAIYVDGQRIAAPVRNSFAPRYEDNPRLREGCQLGPTEYFVLGDNSAVSDDSRSWPGGPGLDAKLLVGRPIGVR